MTTNPDTGRILGVDLDAVARRLSELGTEVAPPLTGHRVGLGQSNLTYRIEDAGGRCWVLRRPPIGHLLESAHDVAREYRILGALAGTDVPVPHVLGLVGDGADQLVMEYVDGLVIDRMDAAAFLPHQVRAGVGPSLARTLAALHAVDVEEAGLLDLASHRPYAERQLRRWERQLDGSRTRELPDLDRLTTRLLRCVPEQRELVLVHGDLHIRNVICSPWTGEVRAVLDWELSTLGDPLADLGTLLAYWWQEGEAPPGFFAASALDGFAGRDELVATYLDATGRDRAALGFWHVLAMWKIAIIAEGIRHRALDEPRNAAEGGPPSTLAIDQLIGQAWELVRHYRL
ncbi:phosphotransferase family protein [Actinomadura luteofluorescens]|uniref:phosphotransferase family protein n=1 Tax=Actinomadura luteofluorescens TaxID=46163 RepID=UPI0021646CB5|nr:phosphotransferase family protein [Actinomadura glauciflava]MCR3745025.1 putative kinase, aminoglycoside phosphotransferase (APT) family [Actinomadura glauciflava]